MDRKPTNLSIKSHPSAGGSQGNTGPLQQSAMMIMQNAGIQNNQGPNQQFNNTGDDYRQSADMMMDPHGQQQMLSPASHMQ